MQTMLQTVHQHESQITVWLLVLRLIHAHNQTVSSWCLPFKSCHPSVILVLWSQHLTCVAVRPGPAFQTGLVSVKVACVMPKELIPGPAKLVAAKAVVVLVTADPDLVFKLGHMAVVSQLLPVQAGVDHAGVRGFLYQPPICTQRTHISFDTVNAVCKILVRNYILSPRLSWCSSHVRGRERILECSILTLHIRELQCSQWSYSGKPKTLTQIAEDLLDSRLYVIKASMCAGEEEKYKEEMQKKGKGCQ